MLSGKSLFSRFLRASYDEGVTRLSHAVCKGRANTVKAMTHRNFGSMRPNSFMKNQNASPLRAFSLGNQVLHDSSSKGYQIRYRSNRSRRGLYDGKDIRSGNKRSFSMKKTKRKFKPNVFLKRVYSEILDEMVRFHLTASALRSIDKAGGLDNYLLTSKHVQEGEGLAVKKRILNKMKRRGAIENKSSFDSSENEAPQSTE